MVKYFSDIYNSTTAILSGMLLTINHLFRAKKGIATLYNTLKKDGQGQKEQ